MMRRHPRITRFASSICLVGAVTLPTTWGHATQAHPTETIIDREAGQIPTGPSGSMHVPLSPKQTPGVTVWLEEIVRIPRGLGGKVGYAIRTSGLPPDRTYTVLYSGLSTNWTPVTLSSGVRPDASGSLAVLAATALYREDDDRGESLQIEIVADDDSIYAVDKVFPFPIEAADGACHVWAEVTTRARDRFLLWLDGFRPREKVRITSADACDAQEQLHTIGPDGRLLSGVVHCGPAGTAVFSVSTPHCAVRLTYEYGRQMALPIAFNRANTDTQPRAGAEPGVLVVFVRTGCPHCADAKVFLADYVKDHPTLRVVYRPVDEDPGAAADLVAVYQELGMWPPGVPTFVMNDQVLVGFRDAEHTGPGLRELIETGLRPADEVKTALFGTLSASHLGLPLFTVALGLLDGFNPCAMWVLLFLLSLLVRLQNRARLALIAGMFVLVSGAVYYAFMAAWLNVFLILGMSAALRWTLGGVALAIGGVNVKDFFAWGRGLSLSIPASAKPGLYARARSVLNADRLATSLVAVAALAVVVNAVELLCTAGLPAIYTAVLTQHDLSALAYYGYLGLYILGYVADDSVMVATAVMALGSRKLTERGGRWLKLVSGVVMLTLGAVLVAWPEWLL